jgi:hypothetical protein
MEEDLHLRTARQAQPGQDALRAILEETRTALARAQRRNERSDEQLAAFSRQLTFLWMSLAILAGFVILLAIYVVLVLRKTG